ncbi:MAG: CHAT domain-containing protein [Anaerolineae bacterium]|nr:CHAT domain-containing protein [Anaerolineae bacterium]
MSSIDIAGNQNIVGDHNVIHVFQQMEGAARRQQQDPRHMLRVLVLLAAPVTGPQPNTPTPAWLDLHAEWQHLADAVRRSGAPIALIRLAPPTLDALRFALSPRAVEQNLAPHVLHVSGHGWSEGLYLEDAYGRAHALRTADLLALAQDLPQPLRLAVFNACLTAAGANAAAQAAVDGGLARAALGHTAPVQDDTAIRFAAALYAELARGGYPLAEALARAQAAIAGQPDRYTPRPFGDLSVELGGLPAGEPLIADGRPPGSLPIPAADAFFGRGEELVALAEALEHDHRRVVVLSGVAGIGKSALSVEAARRNAWRFPGGVTAARAYDQSRAIKERLGDVVGLSFTLYNLSTLAERDGKLNEAIELMEQVVAIDKRVGHPDLPSDTRRLESLKRERKL